MELSEAARRLLSDAVLNEKRVAGTRHTLREVIEPVVRECDALVREEADQEGALAACVREVLEHIAYAASSLRDLHAREPPERLPEVKRAALSSAEFRKTLNGRSLAELAEPLFNACEEAVRARAAEKPSAAYLLVCASSVATFVRAYLDAQAWGG